MVDGDWVGSIASGNKSCSHHGAMYGMGHGDCGGTDFWHFSLEDEGRSIEEEERWQDGSGP